jgi:hypothetical protein
MIPQHLAKLRRGTRIEFARWLGHARAAMSVGFHEGAPFCVQRSAFDAVGVLFPRPDALPPCTLRIERPRRRVMGAAASPDGRVLVGVFEDPGGACIVVRTEGGERSLVYPEDHSDVCVVTDGRTIVVSSHRTRVWSIDVELKKRVVWPIDGVYDLRARGGEILMGTPDAWSRFTFEGKLVRTTPAPRMAAYSRAALVAWDDETPIFHGMHDATKTFDAFVWNGRAASSIGESRWVPHGALTSDALVISRTPPRVSRRLELWSRATWTLVEALEIRGSAITLASSSGPAGDEITLAARGSLFTMRARAS